MRSDANDYLPRLWATRRVGWLMEQVRSNGEQKELRDEIVDLGTRYGIVTPYTSYLALEDGDHVDNGLRAAAGAAGSRASAGRTFGGLECAQPGFAPPQALRCRW